MGKSYRDSDGKRIRSGMHLVSSYGIPPVRIVGEVALRGRRLWVLTPGHNPSETSLQEFLDCLGDCWILAPEEVEREKQRAKKDTDNGLG